MTFLVGGILGIIAWARGGTILQRAMKANAAAVTEMQSAGGPPSAELVARLQATQAKLKSIGQQDLALILAAAVLMSVARYI